MKLTLEQIKNVTFGAIEIRENAKGEIEFLKCTEGQSKAWLDYGNDALCMRSKTTSGVRLDFHTNSKNLTFKTAGGAKFELRIDGVLRERFTLEEGESSIFKTVKLLDVLGKEKEDVRVTLAFPSHSIGVLEYVEIDDGAYINPHEFSRKMLFIGDSITQGHNSKFDTQSYAWQVTDFFNADSVINGIGGAYYQPETFEKINFDPEVVILAYGTNDACRFDFAGMKERTTAYLDLVKEAYGEKKVVVISPIWRAKADGSIMGKDFEEKRSMVESEAKSRGFHVVSGLKLVPPIPDFFADTYLHPNDLGFGVFAENLIKELIKIM